MKPVIVLASDSREPSGLGEHMLALGRGLADRFEMVIAATDAPGGHALLTRAASAGQRIKVFTTEQLPHFRQWLDGSGVALLHVHAGIGWEGHDLVRVGKAAGLPVVRTEHLPQLLTSPVQRAAYNAMLLSVDWTIAVSNAVYDSFGGVHVGRRLAVVANGIYAPESSAERVATRAKLGLLAQDQMLLTVARFTEQKGHATLLQAIPAVLHRQPGAKFIWVGDGPDLATMSEAVRNAGLEHAVRLLGPRDDVPDLLAAADAFVLPSLFEGLPLALLEAVALGLPIVATAIGGTLQALGENYPFIAAPGQPPALVDAIIRLLDDPHGASTIGAANRARFQTRFGAERMARQTADIYAAVLATPTRQVRFA